MVSECGVQEHDFKFNQQIEWKQWTTSFEGKPINKLQ